MIYALVHYPEINTERIDHLRMRYDPQANLIAPHVTLIFPLPETVDEPALISHIERVLLRRKPFQIRLAKLERSLDDCLFLTATEGAEELAGLHDDLYTGMLAAYKKADMPYVPHVTLGVFTEQPALLEGAFEVAQQLNLDYESVVNRLCLVKVNNKKTAIVWSKAFSLAK